MLQTKITKMLGIKYPILGGTMMSISTPGFTAAISNAGGLGVLASAIYSTKDELAAAIDEIISKTDKPFGVNLNLFPSREQKDNNKAFVDVLVEKDVKIVETSGHYAPTDLCGRFKEAGMIWIHKCVGVHYAKKVEALGADIITVVGYENGGATGKLDIGTLVLIPTVKDAIGVPMVGGGGVSDGRGLAALLSLGADAVIMGTRLMLTKECPIHDNLKQAFLNANELDTMLVMRSIDATHRVWTNATARKIEEMERANAGFEDIVFMARGEKARKMYKEGDIDAGMVPLGQGIGLIHDIPTVKELFDGIMEEAEKSVKKVAGEDL